MPQADFDPIWARISPDFGQAWPGVDTSWGVLDRVGADTGPASAKFGGNSEHTWPDISCAVVCRSLSAYVDSTRSWVPPYGGVVGCGRKKAALLHRWVIKWLSWIDGLRTNAG